MYSKCSLNRRGLIAHSSLASAVVSSGGLRGGGAVRGALLVLVVPAVR